MRAKKTNTTVRQEQFARAALAIVEQHGLRGLNVARVARAVGVVPSGLYRHYSGKDAVLETVLDLIAERMEANVARARSENEDALGQLHSLLMRHVELIRGNSAIPRVVFSEEMLHGHSGNRRRLYEIIRNYLRQVEEFIRQGVEQGCVRPGVDPEAASVLFLGLLQPSVLLWTMSEGEFDISVHAEAGWDLFVHAIGLSNRRPETKRRCNQMERRQ